MLPVLERFLHTKPGKALARAMTSWDQSLFVHGLYAATVGDNLADRLGLDVRNRELFVIALFLHDVGKTEWPRELVDKQSLNDYDRNLIMLHAEAGANIVIREWPDAPPEVLTVVREHHERVDGSGYPHGRHAQDLHPLSPYAAAVECFTAMTEPCGYRSGAWTSAEALAAMAREYPAQVLKVLSSVAAQSVG